MLMGEYLKQVRKDKKMTLQDVSELSGVATSSISDIEKSKSRNVTNIQKIMDVLGVTWEDSEASGVDFFEEGPSIDMRYQDDVTFIMEWLSKKPKEDLHHIRRMIEFMEHKNEEDSSN